MYVYYNSYIVFCPNWKVAGGGCHLDKRTAVFLRKTVPKTQGSPKKRSFYGHADRKMTVLKTFLREAFK